MGRKYMITENTHAIETQSNTMLVLYINGEAIAQDWNYDRLVKKSKRQKLRRGITFVQIKTGCGVCLMSGVYERIDRKAV